VILVGLAVVATALAVLGLGWLLNMLLDAL